MWIEQKDLIRALEESQQCGRMTDEFATLISNLTRLYISKSRYRFRSTEYEDVTQQAVLRVLLAMHLIDTSRYPFSYLSRIINSAIGNYAYTRNRINHFEKMIDDPYIQESILS